MCITFTLQIKGKSQHILHYANVIYAHLTAHAYTIPHIYGTLAERQAKFVVFSDPQNMYL